jgi:hypothetical protein
MAVDSRPVIDVNDVRNEERLFGGDIVWWLLLLVVSVPILLVGLSQAPQISGFFFLSIGGILAGIAFAQIILRLPYLTNGFMRSVLIVILASAVITGIAFVFSLTLPVPTSPPDVMYKPPVSGG